MDSLLKLPSPPDADRAAVPGVDEVRCRHLFFTDRVSGVEDLGWVARSSHRLLRRGDELIEDGLWFVEWSTGSRAEVLWYSLPYHLLKVDRSCK